MRPCVLLADSLDAAAEARLHAKAEVLFAAGDDRALLELIAQADALIARTHTPVTRRLLEAGTRLRVIGVAGVGVDRVDLTAAAECGVTVLHTPGAASDAVAEFTVHLMLELLRPVRALSAAYAAGRFHEARREPHGAELRDCTIGIVGMGRIGSRVGRILAGVGARVVYNDITPVGPFDYPATPLAKRELWAASDFVTLHVPLTSETRGLVGDQVLPQFKAGARLINTARGAAVDTAALVEALQNGSLAGAALDVTDPEPLPADHPLFALPQCVLTPHVAARTHGGLARMYAVVDDVLAYLGCG